MDICYIKLSWAHNLTNHFRLDKHWRILTVHKHEIYLPNHTKNANSLIPHEILYKTISTLNLPFPFKHDHVHDALRIEGKMPSYRLETCDRGLMLALNDHPIWEH